MITVTTPSGTVSQVAGQLAVTLDKQDKENKEKLRKAAVAEQESKVRLLLHVHPCGELLMSRLSLKLNVRVKPANRLRPVLRIVLSLPPVRTRRPIVQ